MSMVAGVGRRAPTVPSDDLLLRQPSPEPEEAGHPETEVRLARWQSFLIAVGSLVLVFGFGLVVMLAGGAVVHDVDPGRHMDTFAAFHNPWIVSILLGIAVLWLLPPHPWAKRVVAPSSQEQPAASAGGTEDGSGGTDTVHLDVPGPGPSPGQVGSPPAG